VDTVRLLLGPLEHDRWIARPLVTGSSPVAGTKEAPIILIGAFSILRSRRDQEPSVPLPTMTRVGIRGTPHTLRHSLATKAAREGVHVLYLQRILGHSSATITERYFHNSFEDLQRELGKLRF
jgi:integrase